MESLLNNLFSGLATIITGGVAFYIYYSQKGDSKIQAARVLLTEIRIAEERIDEIRDRIANNTTTDLPSIFPTKSWKLYSHLFISDFDQDELKLINSFFDYGELIEDFATRNNNYFWITTEERGKVTVQKIADFLSEEIAKDNTNFSEIVKTKRDIFSLGMDQLNYVYAPNKTLDGIKILLAKIMKITTSSCGIKLKKIAKVS